MDELNSLDRLDIGVHGDRHERELWPLLHKRFPSYEILWRRLIVPLTFRIDGSIDSGDSKWIRMRPDVPEMYEQMAMAHYSIFYFLSRAMKRVFEDARVFKYPEDVLFLLDSAGDNFKRFMQAINAIGADSGIEVFDREPGDRVGRRHEKNISAEMGQRRQQIGA